jgi:amino acid adenylation domain-containing protein/non-ribosomal peptide synthase protein (TIGR01720 family)
MNTVVCGAWAVLLQRYCGEHEVMFGLTVAGRPPSIPEIEHAIGVFINTVPCRVAIDDRPLWDWLAMLQLQQAEAQPFEHSALADIQRWSEVTPGQPLFETIVVYQNIVGGDADRAVDSAPAAEIERVGAVEKINYPLALTVSGRRELSLRFNYDAARLPTTTADRLHRQLARILTGFADPSVQRPRQIDLLAPEERHRILVDWNQTQTPAPSATVDRLTTDAYAGRGDAVALVAGQAHLSWTELDQRVNRFARLLASYGVGPEVIVGLWLERCLDLIVATLGIARAGGAYLPIDRTEPAERVVRMLDEAGAHLLITHRASALDGLDSDVTVIGLKESAERLSSDSHAAIASPAGPDNLAYVIFTSGSTGRRKGVAVTHRNIVGLVRAGGPVQQHSDDVLLQYAPVAFDAATFEIWACLANGARLVIAPPEALSVAELGELVRQEQVTSLWTTCVLFEEIVDRGLDPLASLRQWWTGGDVMAAAHVHRAAASLPACTVMHAYGPTEATTYTTVSPVRGVRAETRLSIGTPLPNRQVYVLDRHGDPVPPGVTGELHIGGSGNARAYWRQPAITAERFVPHPWSAHGDRLYRTGDLVQWRDDGTLEFVGRRDQQVKIRGYRIEPGEIETVLCACPGVAQAVVVPWTAGDQPKRLVAYVVPVRNASITPEVLRAFARARLPEYMTPAAFVSLDAFPIAATGKLDRAALPQPAWTSPAAGVAAPRDDREASLVAIWQTVLGVARVGIHDNFFDLGGDSILSLRIASRASEAGLTLTPRQVFQHQTIAELAAVVAQTPAAEAEQGEIVGTAPLTPIQAAFFASDPVAPHHFNQAIVLQPRESLRTTPLRTAARELLRHHDALRLRFDCRDGVWTQRSTGAAGEPDPVVCIDLRDVSPRVRGRLAAQAADDVQGSLNLAVGPVFRLACFAALNANTDRLLFAAHHLVVDGVSWRVLLDDLAQAYQAAAAGAVMAWPRKTTAYQHWAKQLAARVDARAFDDQAPYWIACGGRPDGRPLPRDRSGPNTAAAAAVVKRTLPEADTRTLLQDAPRVFAAQIDEVLLTALLEAVGVWSGRTRIGVDLEGHGRDLLPDGVDVTRTVGWFTSVYPVWFTRVPADLPGQLQQVKTDLRAIPQRGTGYGPLRFLGPDAALRAQLAAAPHPEISFNYLGQFDQTFRADGFFRAAAGARGRTIRGDERRQYLFEIDLLVIGGRLNVTWGYGRDVTSRATATALAARFVDALAALAERCRGEREVTADFAGLDPKQLASVVRQVATAQRAGSSR